MVRVDFEKKVVIEKTLVNREEYYDMLDAIQNEASDLGFKPDSIIKEMKFVAAHNSKFRTETFPELEELFYELYERNAS